MLLARTRASPHPYHCYKILLFPSARSAISKPILYPSSIYFIHRTVMLHMYTTYNIILLYIHIKVYTRPEISLFLLHPVTVFISDPTLPPTRQPLPNRYRLLSTIFTLRTRIRALQCKTFFLFLSFFFFSFLINYKTYTLLLFSLF